MTYFYIFYSMFVCLDMTASLRRIDQGTLILAPIATGQIMTFGGLQNGAIFIAAWNVMSLFVEYGLLLKVYKTVPALRAEKGTSHLQPVSGTFCGVHVPVTF
jgi:iron-regulated transporter 1